MLGRRRGRGGRIGCGEPVGVLDRAQELDLGESGREVDCHEPPGEPLGGLALEDTLPFLARMAPRSMSRTSIRPSKFGGELDGLPESRQLRP